MAVQRTLDLFRAWSDPRAGALTVHLSSGYASAEVTITIDEAQDIIDTIQREIDNATINTQANPEE